MLFIPAGTLFSPYSLGLWLPYHCTKYELTLSAADQVTSIAPLFTALSGKLHVADVASIFELGIVELFPKEAAAVRMHPASVV